MNELIAIFTLSLAMSAFAAQQKTEHTIEIFSCSFLQASMPRGWHCERDGDAYICEDQTSKKDDEVSTCARERGGKDK